MSTRIAGQDLPKDFWVRIAVALLVVVLAFLVGALIQANWPDSED